MSNALIRHIDMADLLYFKWQHRYCSHRCIISVFICCCIVLHGIVFPSIERPINISLQILAISGCDVMNCITSQFQFKFNCDFLEFKEYFLERSFAQGSSIILENKKPIPYSIS